MVLGAGVDASRDDELVFVLINPSIFVKTDARLVEMDDNSMLIGLPNPGIGFSEEVVAVVDEALLPAGAGLDPG